MEGGGEREGGDTSQAATSVRRGTRIPRSSREFSSSGVGATKAGGDPTILILKHSGSDRQVHAVPSPCHVCRVSSRQSCSSSTISCLNCSALAA